MRLLPVVLEIGLDAFDGVELPGVQVGVGDLQVEGLFEGGDEVGEGERIEQAGVEQRLVGCGGDGLAGDAVQDFIDFRSFVH